MLKPDFLRIHKGLRRLGVDTDPLYRTLEISERDFASGGAGVTMSQYLEFLTLAAQESRQPFLGVALGQISDPDDLGIMSYLIRNAPTFEGWIKLLDRYLFLVSPGAETKLITEGEVSTLTYDFRGFSPDLCRQDVEGTIVQYAQTLRTLVNDTAWQPIHVYFQHGAPAGVEALHEALTERMSFDHFCNGISFPTELLLRPINRADPRLLEILEQQVQDSADGVGARRDIQSELTLLIAANLGASDLSIDRVAPQLGMSRRTLHRRLAEQGTNFSELRDTVFLRTSKEILSTTTASISEIAQQLGYSDSSAFNRAFKRLAGKAPLTYRRAHRHLPK